MRADVPVAARAAKALAVLADLTPAQGRRDADLSVSLEWFRWLNRGVEVLTSPPAPAPGSGAGWWTVLDRYEAEPAVATVRVDRAFGAELAAVQQVREGRNALRLGWLWLVGSTVTVSSTGKQVRRRVFHPLVSRPVRATRQLGLWELQPHGDATVTSLVEDRREAHRLERQVELGGGAFTELTELTPSLLGRLPRLRSFARACGSAAGFPDAALTLERGQPEDLMRRDGVRIVVGLAVYTTDEPSRTTRAGSLLAWPDSRLEQPTAFHAVYGGLGPDRSANGDADAVPVLAPLPLTPRQAEVVAAARHRLVTVVSGAPGTGKSHTLVGVVCDALRRGETVLVAAKNDAAVDALSDLMSRQPGLTPVVFGASERRTLLAQRLASGQLHPASAEQVDTARRALDAAIDDRARALDEARRALQSEWRRTPAARDVVATARRSAPGIFDDTDRPGLGALVAAAAAPATSWRQRRKRRRAERQLRRRIGATDDVAVETIAAVFDMTGTSECTVTEACDRVHASDALVRQQLAAWLAVATRGPDRVDRAGLATVAAMATALRAGRSARRLQLERLGDRTLTRALPLWMGTLGDVDDLLPPVPALFDLVLIDEASSTEQTIAATTLLRGRRAVIVGDPHQLRHVSFIGDDTISRALEQHAVDDTDRAQLDVRRNSLFDAATTASPVIDLDEHFRSAPHLIDVVADTIYHRHLHVATRSPLTESLDCVHLHQTNGTRNADGVIRSEIDAVIGLLKQFPATLRNVGVITPFRAQADALEAAILASFSAEDLIRLGARVGTVHSFQGNERDAIICSLALADDDTAGWTFASDPHLLAVMLTRARQSMTLVTGCTPEPSSILGRYIATADRPPGTPAPHGALSPWAREIYDDLRLAGLTAHHRYPTGRHTIDIVTAVGDAPAAIICDLHPDGIDAHIERHVALLTQGWRTINALASEWEDRQPELILELAAQLPPSPSQRVL